MWVVSVHVVILGGDKQRRNKIEKKQTANNNKRDKKQTDRCEERKKSNVNHTIREKDETKRKYAGS